MDCGRCGNPMYKCMCEDIRKDHADEIESPKRRHACGSSGPLRLGHPQARGQRVREIASGQVA